MQARALRLAVVCAVLLVAVYLLAVWTPAGQRFDDWVLDGSAQVNGGRQEGLATWMLAHINAVSVLVALVLVLAIGFLRGRPFLGVVSAAVLVCSVLATEFLQRTVVRPILLDSGVRRQDQSFPSGHTSAAMAIMCAMVLVVPHRIRTPVAVATSVGAIGVAIATVSANWHRPSDTVGSDLIVLGSAALGVLLLASSNHVRPAASYPAQRRTSATVLPITYGIVAVLAGAVAAVQVAAVLAGAAAWNHAALVAGQALALAGGASVTLLMLLLVRATDLVPSTLPGQEP